MTWELVNPNPRRSRFRVAVFDFDGTVSLIREGWSGIMATLGLDLLRERNLPTAADTHEYLEDQMLRLSGKPSIFQMRRLGEIVAERGGAAPDPDALLEEFLKRLFAAVGSRKVRLASGEDAAETWAVAGTHQLLSNLRDRGVELYLVSGTDLDYVREEAQLLKLTPFFGERIFAPADNTPNFTKGAVFDRILRDHRLDPAELVSFGDGFSETVEAKRVGALAVGVASQEAGVPGVNAMKRRLLVELGADAIVPDYRHQHALVEWLFGT